jgi:acetyl-CoA carboxylase carboxyltransferase component
VRSDLIKLNMRELTQELEKRLASTLDSSRPHAVEKQARLGKLTARKRLELLFDPGTFIEFGQLAAASRAMGKESPADGVIVGIGKVDNRPVALINYDFTVMGGTQGRTSHLKTDHLQRKAMDQGIPIVYLLDGGGARAQEADLFVDHDPSIWYEQARTSGWVPMIAGVMGPCYAGHANIAALCDGVIMVEGTSSLGNAGPRLIRDSLGQEIDPLELGGAKIHSEHSGIADMVAGSDVTCINKIKEFLSFFPSNSSESAPIIYCDDPIDRREEALLDMVPHTLKRMYDMYPVIRAIVDHGRTFEFKPAWGQSIITCLARLNGRPVGIVANQPMVMAGAMDVHESEKMAHFVEMCDAFNIPMVFLSDVPGFWIGPDQEKRGLARRAMKPLYVLAHCSVPLITINIRKSFGIAGYIMGCRAIRSTLFLAWPTAQLGGMGIEGIVEMIYHKEIAASQNPDQLRLELIERTRKNMGALETAKQFRFDAVIDPRDTRPVLIKALEIFQVKNLELPPKKHGIAPF